MLLTKAPRKQEICYLSTFPDPYVSWEKLKVQYFILAKSKNSRYYSINCLSKLKRVQTPVAKTSNVIELNGKKYDALTGALLDIKATPSHSTFVKSLAVHAPTHHGSVDGMIGTKHVSSPTAVKPKITKKLPTAAHKAIPVAHHQPERSKTLMRHAVKAPVIAPKAAAKTVAPLQKSLPAKLAVKPKLSSDVIDLSRSKRAVAANRNQMVRRFNNGVAPVRSQHHPAATPQPATKPTQQLTVIHNQPQTHPRPAAHDIRRPVPIHAAPARKSTAQPSKALFEQALASATSHEQPPLKEPVSRKVRRGAKKREHARIRR